MRRGAFFLLFSLLWAQGQVTAVEPNLYVCGPQETVTVTAFNTGASTLTGVQLSVQMPPGVEYVLNTVSPPGVNQISTNPPHQPVFGLPNLPPNSNLTITFQVRATCEVIPFLADQNNDVKNTYTLTWSGGGSASYTSANEYIIDQPALQYASITNQTYVATTIPQTFTRTFTVKNAGTAPLSSFRHTETAQSGVTIVGAAGGNIITHDPSNLVLEFSAAHFDGLFDPDESLTFEVTYTVNSCTNTQSTFSLTWGCNSQVCATTTATGAVNASGLGVPNLGRPIYNSGHGWFRFVQERACYGDNDPSRANRVRLGFRNTGNGSARDIEIDLYVTNWPYTDYVNNVQERIDINSITVSQGVNGPPLPYQIVPGSVDAGTNNACFTAQNVVKKLTLLVSGPIASGQELYVEYDLYTCALSSVFPCPSGRRNLHFHALSSRVRYKSLCGEAYSHIIQGFGRGLAQAAVLNDHPASVANGQLFSACFTITENPGSIHDRPNAFNSLNGAPSSNNYRFRWEITLPSAIQYTSGPVQWTSNAAGVPLWTAFQVTQVGNLLYVDFRHDNRPAGWSNWHFQNSFICVPLQVVCGGSPSGVYPISTRLLYSTDATCNNDYACWGFAQPTEIAVNCPTPCPQGVEMIAFSMERTSYGLKDDDNNGIADGNTPPTLNLIKRYRLMHTDTATARYTGVIRGGPWNHVWAILQIDNHGRRFVALDASIVIRKAQGGPTHTFTRPVSAANYGNIAPHNRRFAIDLRVSTLTQAGVVPDDFKWEANDTVRIALRVRLNENIGGNIFSTRATPYLYTTSDASSLPNNLAPHDTRHECGVWRENLELVGWFYNSTEPLVFSPTAASPCQADVELRYYLAIGPCCAYCGSNLFPFEYRQWSLPNYFDVTLPRGWRPVSGTVRFWHIRTQGSSDGLTSTCISQQLANGTDPQYLGADNNGNTQWRFHTLGYFQGQGQGGSLYPSTGSYWGYLRFRVEPSCESRIYELEGDASVGYKVFFTPRLDGSVSPPDNRLVLRYSGPNLQVNALPATVPVGSNTVEWRVQIRNLSNALPATNTFVYFRTATSTLSVTQVIDEASNNVINPIGDVYPLANSLSAGGERYIRVRATFTSCRQDTLFVYAGWSCSGYPQSARSYVCYDSAPRDTLLYVPTQPNILLSTSVSPNPSNRCDVLTVEVTLQNGGGSAAYEPFLFMVLPPGVNYIGGSSQYAFPGGGPWQQLADPGTVFGSLRVWNLTNQTSPDGIRATGNHSTFKVRFQIVTTCEYTNNQQIRFLARYKNYCGQFQFRIGASPIMALRNAIVPYDAAIDGPNHTVERCRETLTYTLSITNLGPGSTTSSDSVRVTFPAGFTYVANSTTGLSNFTQHNPLITTNGGNVIMQWGLQEGHGTNATISFSFQVEVGPSLPSGVYNVSVQTLINATQACGANTCKTFLSTGTANLNLTINRPVGVWTGDVDENWFEPNNWRSCQVPTCDDDVTIPTAPRGGNYPAIHDHANNGAASCRDLTVEPGAILIMGSDGQLDICRHVTFQDGSILQAGAGSKVRFVGSTSQNYEFRAAGDWYDVEMAQGIPGRRLILLTDLRLDGTLTLTTGVIDGFSNNKEVYVRRPSASAVTTGNLDSYVSGVLRRNVNTNAIDGWYHLPVGNLPSGRGYELAQVRFEAVPATRQLRAAFYPWPGVLPSSAQQTDCGAPFGLLPNLNHGYWVIDRTDGGPTPYHLRLYSRGYTNASGQGYTIVKRPTGSGAVFGFEGVCEGDPFKQASQTGRLNLQDFSEFAIAQSEQPLPVSHLLLRTEPRQNVIALFFTSRLTGEVSHYEILRSEDATSWNRIATLPASLGTVQGTEWRYQWVDLNVRADIRYWYQVAAVSPYGERILSNIGEALLKSEGQALVQLYPNPSEGAAWVRSTEAGLSVRVVDMSGKVMWEGTTGEEPVRLPADLPGGAYIVEVGSERLRWVKVR